MSATVKLRMLLKNPREAAARALIKLELARDRQRFRKPESHERVRALSRTRYGYVPAEHWLDRVHDALEVQCDLYAAFEAHWTDLQRELPSGYGLDADPALARLEYCLARHLRPRRIVETGVARGISSRFLLLGLYENATGELVSIDLPPLESGWEEPIAVPVDLRSRWTFVRASSREVLPDVLQEPVDLFIHDSLHTYRNMKFELEVAWAALTPRGVLVCDDIHENRAFAEFQERTAAATVVGQEELKAGLVGIAFRSPG